MGKKAKSSAGKKKALERKIDKAMLPPPPPKPEDEVRKKMRATQRRHQDEAPVANLRCLIIEEDDEI